MTFLTAQHLPCPLITVADCLSLTELDSTEWTLHVDVFQLVSLRFGSPIVDLFASHVNNWLQRFVSWLPHRGGRKCGYLHGPVASCFPLCQSPPPPPTHQSVLQERTVQCSGDCDSPYWPRCPGFSDTVSIPTSPFQDLLLYRPPPPLAPAHCLEVD